MQYRVERDQRVAVLWPDSDARARAAGRERDADRVWWDWYCAVPRGVACDRVHRPARYVPAYMLYSILFDSVMQGASHS